MGRTVLARMSELVALPALEIVDQWGARPARHILGRRALINAVAGKIVEIARVRGNQRAPIRARHRRRDSCRRSTRRSLGVRSPGRKPGSTSSSAPRRPGCHQLCLEVLHPRLSHGQVFRVPGRLPAQRWSIRGKSLPASVGASPAAHSMNLVGSPGGFSSDSMHS